MTRLCENPDCTEPTWMFQFCREHAMVPLGQEDPEDRRDDPGGDE